MRKVILDTDPGVDDAMALFFLTASPGLELIGITTVFGNADVETTTRNARYLTQRFSIDAPVFKGAAAPLQIARHAAPVHIHGENALGDIDLSGASLAPLAATPAHLAIVELVRAHPHQVTLIAIGPLTNLSLALSTDPEIAELVAQVIVMGGAFGTHGRHGNVSPVAEANIHNDPQAADHVFSAPWPVVIVGLDVTLQCVMDDAMAETLARTAGARGEFIWRISRGYAEVYQARDGLAGCCLHDVAAVAYAIDPALFQTRLGPVRVVSRGPAIGQTLQRLGQETDPSNAWGLRPSQTVCIGVADKDLVRRFGEALASSGASTAADGAA